MTQFLKVNRSHLDNSQVARSHIQLRHKAPPRSMMQLNREVISQSTAGLS